jgi:hypothetical protein
VYICTIRYPYLVLYMFYDMQCNVYAPVLAELLPKTRLFLSAQTSPDTPPNKSHFNADYYLSQRQHASLLLRSTHYLYIV